MSIEHFFLRTIVLITAGFASQAILATGASAQTLLDCSTSPSVEPRVSLTWPALPTEGSLATQPTSTTLLVLSSRAAEALDYELVARMTAGGERIELSLASGTLPPLGTTTLAVPLAGLGIDIDDLDFSGSLRVEARVYSTTSIFLDRAYAPQLFFHRDLAGPYKIYRDAVRRSLFNAGDLHGTVFSAAPPQVLGVFDGGAGIGSGGEDHGPRLFVGGLHAPAQPLPFGVLPQWEFCLRWVYESVDSGFGEDYYTSGELMKARGMRVVVNHPNWGAPKSFFASQDNGCFSFYAAENSGFTVTLYAEARLGQNDDVTVRAFRNKTQAVTNPTNPPQWVFVANPGGAPRRVYYQNEASEISNLMAFGSFVFYWVDHDTLPGLGLDAGTLGAKQMTLLADNPDCDGSCQSGNYVEIEPGRSNQKFLVGHEVGHWMNRQWTNDDMGYFNDSWSANSSDPDCAFVGVGSHAMRSKERSSGGFIEGFAHYLCALAWNRHDQTGGIFRYYKEVPDATYADLAADNWIVDLDGIGATPSGGVSNWMANMCFVTDGHSVEMDWLRFLWDYRTNSGTKPTHHDIFRHVQFTRTDHPWLDSTTTYDRLMDAILDPVLGQAALQARYLSLAATNGVAQ